MDEQRNEITTPARDSEMSQALSALSLENDKLTEVISVLEKRLITVLREEDQDGGVERTTADDGGLKELASRNYSAPRAAQIGELANKNRNLRRRVESILNKLEV